LVERCEHRFQLNTHHGGDVCGYTNVLLQCGKKAGQSHAYGIKPGSELFAAENALRVSQEIKRRSSRDFRNQLHGRAELRNAGSVVDDSGDLSSSGLYLPVGRIRRDNAQTHSGQDPGAQDSETRLLHVGCYLPPALPVFAAVLVSAGAFTTNSADLVTVLL